MYTNRVIHLIKDEGNMMAVVKLALVIKVDRSVWFSFAKR